MQPYQMSKSATTVGLSLIYALSTAGKLKHLIQGTEHKMMGVGKSLPGWFLPIAIAHETLTFALLATGPWTNWTGIGLLASAGFMGGVTYMQFQIRKPIAMIPWLLVCSLTINLWRLSEPATDTELEKNLVLTLLYKPNAWCMGLAYIGGLVLGTVLASMNPKIKV